MSGVVDLSNLREAERRVYATDLVPAQTAAVADVLAEIEAKNTVRVVKFESLRPSPFARRILRKTLDDLSSESRAAPPAAILADHIRMLAGRPPIYLAEIMRRLGGDLIGVEANLRTDVGKDFVANCLGGTQPASADYIAISNNNLAVAAGDTAATLPWSTAQATDAAASGTTGEWTALGLARASATYAHTVNTTLYTLTKTWTATATSTATSKAGNFGGSTRATQGSSATTNILFLANTFTSTSLVNNDQLQLTWTVNI